MIVVDEFQCARVADRLDAVQVNPDEFLVRAETSEEKRREANLWFFLVAICQSTRTLQGTLEGQWYRGWDYMAHAARRALRSDPETFTAARLVNISDEELRSLFSDDGVAEHSTFDRIEERMAQWHDASQVLLDHYEGDVMVLYEAAGRRLRDTSPQHPGILARLSETAAYSDPVEKKSFLFTMFAQRCGAWEIRDLENLKVAIDYHIMRIALRSGMVRVQDAALERRLKARQPVTAEEDNLVREAVRQACDVTVRRSRHSIFDVDNILWMMGRNCCFYDHEPFCGWNTCEHQEECTFIRSTGYLCPGQCLLDGVCLASCDPHYRAYWETTLYTEFY